MSRIVILGGGGFLGVKLAQEIANRGEVRGAAVTSLVQADLAAPEPVEAGFPVEGIAVDIRDRAALDSLFDPAPDIVFHLAAVVSGQAEAEFDLGLSINLMGTVNVLEAAKGAGNKPIVVFTSSVAVYGGENREPLVDTVLPNPQTSYGAQKLIGEVLINDFTRKGFIDGRGLRLPTITVRKGKPNAAASSFMSSIFREPLQGDTANCPAGEDYPIWHSSARTVIWNLIHAAEIDGADIGPNRCFAANGRKDTVAEMIAAMTSVAGPEPASRITWNREPVIEPIFMGWMADVDPAKARALGFRADESFEDNIRYFLEDDIERD